MCSIIAKQQPTFDRNRTYMWDTLKTSVFILLITFTTATPPDPH
jgi:hypothetical protein